MPTQLPPPPSAQPATAGGALPPAALLRPGDTLKGGRYVIEKELNRGGTAVVYSARDMHTGGVAALKVMYGPEQVPLKVVKREIALSSSIQHDNMVCLVDVFTEGQQLVLVWELVAGPDLLDLLNENQGRLPEAMACFFFVQLLEAVTFMHAAGFCHRDIKPENCMVQRSSQRLKLIDFGLSKHLASAHTLGVGTPDYMCPELLPRQGMFWGMPAGAVADAPSYDAKAVDAWAMGVLMFLLTTGKYPFEDPRHPQNLAHTITNVLSGRMQPFPDSMSDSCRQLIAGLLQPDPHRRTTLEELKADAWLTQQAASHAQRIGRPGLLDFSRYKPTHASAPTRLSAVLEDVPTPSAPERAPRCRTSSKRISEAHPPSALARMCTFLRRKAWRDGR